MTVDRTNSNGKGKKKSPSSANRLVKVAIASAELFHDANQEAYATVRVKGHRETYKIRSRFFRRWLGEAFFRETKQVASSQAMADAVNTLEGLAIFTGQEIETHIRVAEHDGKVYLDLANDAWQAVEIVPDGWKVIDDPPVQFRRPTGMRSLPTPIPGGCVDELRRFVNVANDQDFMLLVAFLIGALCPTGPYFVLHLVGEQGSAKSFLVRLIRLLLDPNMAAVRCETRDIRDLMIAAKNGRIITLDNLSKLPDWLSDALCRLSTGGGFSTRILYTDDDEMIFDAYRPVVLTSIKEVVVNPDLLDRSIRLTCPSISNDQRQLERKILVAFEKAHPRILGCLLDGVAAALKNIGTFELPVVSRMADASEWVCAACPAFRWSRDDFLEAYKENTVSSHDLAIEATPVGPVLIEWIEKIGGSWSGTATALLDDLNKHAGHERGGDGPGKRRPKDWPGAPHVLSGQLRVLATDLQRAVGLSIVLDKRDKRTRKKTITITTNAPDPTPERSANASGGADCAIPNAPNAPNASSHLPVDIADAGGVMGKMMAELSEQFPDDPELPTMLDRLCEWTDLFHLEDGHPLELAARMAFEKVVADLERERGAA